MPATKKGAFTIQEVRDQTLDGAWSYSNPPLAGDTVLFITSNAGGVGGIDSSVAPAQSSPVQVPGIGWCMSIIPYGANGAQAIKTDGTMWAWGSNSSGRIGNNSSVDTSSPVQIPGTTWCMLGAAGATSFGIKTDNTLWAWGADNYSQLAQNISTGAAVSSPIQIPGTTWCWINMGLSQVFGIKTDNTLWAWGADNYGSMGIGVNAAARSSPVQIPGTTWSKACGGYTQGLAIKTNGQLWSWGEGLAGNLGNGNSNVSSPIQVPGNTWCAVSGHGEFSMALKTDNTLWSWGRGSSGQLGTSSTTSVNSPVQVPGTTWCAVTSGYQHSAALKTDGTLWGWACSNCVGLNLSANVSSPIQIPGTCWSRLGCHIEKGIYIKTLV